MHAPTTIALRNDHGTSGEIWLLTLWCTAKRCPGLINEILRWIGVAAMTIGMLKIITTRIPQVSAAWRNCTKRFN